MADRKASQRGYGLGQGLIELSPKPIWSQRTPNLGDRGIQGQEWIVEPTNQVYFFAGNDATGGSIWTLTGGTSQTASAASPTAAVTINSKIGSATFTGFTTATGAASAETLTINNSLVTTATKVLISTTNGGANDARMTVTRVVPTAGVLTLTVDNLGTAALNGDIVITYRIID